MSPTIVTPSRTTVSPGSVAAQLPARLGREVDDHRPRPHPAHGVLGDQDRSRAARDEGRRDDGVRLVRVPGDELLLPLVLVLGERHGVAAHPLRALHVELEEGRAEALDLLLHDRADVEGRDDGAQSPGGGDRLEAGHAGPEHEHLRGRDRPRGRREHREELPQVLGREERGLVPRDRALGRERVHRLRSRHARDAVHRERGDALGGELSQRLGVGERLEEPDQRLPRAEGLDLRLATACRRGRRRRPPRRARPRRRCGHRPRRTRRRRTWPPRLRPARREPRRRPR